MTNETTANDTSLHSSEAMLVDDLKRIVGDADELLNELAGASSDELETTREKFAARLREARARVDQARVELARKACHAAEAANDYVRENPRKVAAVVALAALGVLAAVLLERRSSRNGHWY